ncbi:hypothetical protein GCM10010497_46270 [Streptomyces cinereoruber]|uniref:WXG100 family type VII secretion target n=1 Tax=Streptomyces cinereoruber TaxID=67260 RepID=A0AAV4KML0_9ACTN|nr:MULTISPECIES: hypothetical protein [Streptomyces]AVH96991.1 hypothetical protein C5L38_19560 [Streptomyces sp. WAC00288]KYG55600.1 hypothetical protein AWI43_15215 [Streptomyces sp. WAC04657]MBB4160096.1 hypothetical protein [Streptomyces cinereoruber]MBY8818294.1 hypothetical protein [Streptomyces cinereoruber]NIH61034.1 hypothetical protein [Streptomyces cinereoruber]
MDLETLRQGSFGQLSQAITAWKGVVDKLKTLETDARDDLKAKADKANWAGVNATVSREFITKTAGEFADAHTQAKSIHDILKDTHDELVSYKQQLEQALERGRKKNLTVAQIPGGFTVTMIIHPDRAAKGHEVPDHSPQDAEHLRDDIQVILDRATESDSTAATVLRALVDQAGAGFSGAEYGDRDSAIDALRKAEEAAKLLKEKGDEMSPEEFRKLNGLLASYRNDPLFQEKFATQVGPKAMLEFWADLSSPDSTKDLTRTQLAQLGDFQKNLGFVLGGATQSDSPAMRQWENDMVKLGGERFHTRTGDAYGFQIMSNLMRTGDYDDRFLNKYGSELVATEQKMKIPDRFYLMEPSLKMNFIGDAEFGRDPMTGFMTALSNSPDAATQFFNTTEPQDNAKWVLKERPSFDDSPLKDGPNESLDATGKAMFAAVSGATGPDAPKSEFGEHPPERREAMKRTLDILASTGNDFPAELRDDMAYSMGSHSDWVHKSMSSPLVKHELDSGQLMEVSKQISRNQESYTLLNKQMHGAIAADIYTEKTHPEDSLDRAGRTIGFLEEARYQATNDEKGEKLADASWEKAGRYHVIGGLVTPWHPAGDAAQRVVDLITSKMLEDEQNRINADATSDHTKTYENRRFELQKLADIWYQENKEWAEDPTHEGFSKEHGVYAQIEGSANDGNKKAEGVAGVQ